MSEWISVKDELPEPNEIYLVHCPSWSDDECAVCLFENGKWYYDHDSEINSYVTHWMPLPEPPKETK
jgi:hypothetical protein